MRQHYNRKTTPQVVGGAVQKKNNPEGTASYYDTTPPSLVIDRQRPGKGYRHLLLQRDVETFIGLLPDWAELSKGLNAIVLAPGGGRRDGYYGRGVVHVCAWEANLWIDFQHNTTFFDNHEPIFRRLGVPMKRAEDGYTLCQFTEAQARAYQLLHILLHELGHHHDRMTTKSKVRASRGEPYAEAYAIQYEALVWERYLEKSGVL